MLFRGALYVNRCYPPNFTPPQPPGDSVNSDTSSFFRHPQLKYYKFSNIKTFAGLASGIVMTSREKWWGNQEIQRRRMWVHPWKALQKQRMRISKDADLELRRSHSFFFLASSSHSRHKLYMQLNKTQHSRGTPETCQSYSCLLQEYEVNSWLA